MLNVRKIRLDSMHTLFCDELKECINTLQITAETYSAFMSSRMEVSAEEYDACMTHLGDTMTLVRKLHVHLLMNTLEKKIGHSPSVAMNVPGTSGSDIAAQLQRMQADQNNALEEIVSKPMDKLKIVLENDSASKKFSDLNTLLNFRGSFPSENRFSYKRADLGVYHPGDHVHFAVSIIVDLQRLLFFVADANNGDGNKIAKLSRKQPMSQLTEFPKQNEVFGLAMGGCIFRAVGENVPDRVTRFGEGKETVMLIDTGLIMDITKETVLYHLEPELQQLAGLALPAELVFDPSEDIYDLQRKLFTFMHEKVEYVVKAVHDKVLQIEMIGAEELKSAPEGTLAYQNTHPQNENTKMDDPQDENTVTDDPQDENTMTDDLQDGNTMTDDPQDEKTMTNDLQDEDTKTYDLHSEDIMAAESQVEDITTAEPQVEDITTAEPQVEDITTAEPQVEDITTAEPQVEDPKIRESPEESHALEVEQVDYFAALRGQIIGITVLHVVDVDRLYAFIHETTTEDFFWDASQIHENLRLDKMPQIYQIVLAQYVDRQWYRARVEEVIDEELVRVFFVDYGNEDTVPLNYLAHCDADIALRPYQAVLCCLAHLCAAPDMLEKRKYFTGLISGNLQNQEVCVKVEDTYADVLYITFIDEFYTKFVADLQEKGVLLPVEQYVP